MPASRTTRTTPTARTTATASTAKAPSTAPRKARTAAAALELAVKPPFRLDLTANALRRVATNVVDVYTPEGTYLHAFADAHGPAILRVTQPDAGRLAVSVEGGGRDAAQRALALARRSLGVDHDLRPFYSAARQLPWLDPLARRMRGIKPPRYRSLWEAVVNSVVFQQVSLHAATAVVRRLVTTMGTPVHAAEGPLYVFPGPECVLDAPDTQLREMGLSASKIATLRRMSEAIAAGTLDEAMIEERPSADAAQLLCSNKGIGPWTANVILLRGFGRMDVFPGNDSGVARNLTLVTGEQGFDVERVLTLLGAHQGLLYFHLLLARLEQQGAIAHPPAAASRRRTHATLNHNAAAKR